MEKEGIDALLKSHRFFEGMDAETLALIAGCGKNVRFPAGGYLARQGRAADRFYAVREGRVALELQAAEKGVLVLQTVRTGEILGWSWLFPPYVWTFDARAIDDVRGVEFDGTCLRAKCEANTAMGFDLMRRFATVFANRMEAAVLQLLDMYGKSGPA